MISPIFSQPRLETSQQHFSKVPQAEVPRSVFNRNHQYKTTFDAGYLVPIYVDEVLPGDTFKCRVTTFARLNTPLHPIMDNMYADVFFFFVPNRLIWTNWERFNGAQDDPADSTDFLVPVMESPASTGYAVGTLHDYFGIPTGVPELEHISLFHRAYNLIWNQWFRDENLQDSVVVDTDNGPDDPADYVLLKRGKRHDYFTSCLPWTQKGTAITLPLGTSAPVVTTNVAPEFYTSLDSTNRAINVNNPGAGLTLASYASGTEAIIFDSVTGLQTDLSAATAASINAIREAFQLQRLLERDARGGTRYVELLKAHFGVTSPDFRLQRPEYLGGGSTPISTAPVPQTSATGASGTAQGNLAAMGVFSHSGAGFTKSFVEHGVILGLLSVRADLTYQQGLNRMFSRQTRYDYYWPALAHLGEQAVLNKEIYAQGSVDPTDDADVFGYQERYAEYRYKPSMVTGLLRSSASGTLDTWHLAQSFANLPVLSAGFIEESPPIARIVAVDSEPDFLLDCAFDLQCARPMPVYSVPGLVDHL